jgi:hypothetical protein
MASTKISQLPVLGTMSGSTIVPVVDGGVTKTVTGSVLRTYTGTASGPQGPQGVAGSQGPQGPSGPSGSAAAAGMTLIATVTPSGQTSVVSSIASYSAIVVVLNLSIATPNAYDGNSISFSTDNGSTWGGGIGVGRYGAWATVYNANTGTEKPYAWIGTSGPYGQSPGSGAGAFTSFSGTINAVQIYTSYYFISGSYYVYGLK